MHALTSASVSRSQKKSTFPARRQSLLVHFFIFKAKQVSNEKTGFIQQGRMQDSTVRALDSPARACIRRKVCPGGKKILAETPNGVKGHKYSACVCVTATNPELGEPLRRRLVVDTHLAGFSSGRCLPGLDNSRLQRI